MSAVKSVVSKMARSEGSVIGRATKSIIGELRDAGKVTFANTNKEATSLTNAWASKVNKKVASGNTKIIPGVHYKTPDVHNLYTGVGLTKGADTMLGAAIIGASLASGAFKSTNLSKDIEKHKASRTNEMSAAAPHTGLGEMDYGITDATGMGYGASTAHSSYRTSRDYSLGATGDLTLGLHKSRRR